MNTKTLTARFNSKCAATGQPIRKGQTISYDPIARRAYLPGNEPKSEDNRYAFVADPGVIDADNFCVRNGI